ncbi:Phosphotransferase enzyme family protein [Actinopolymorpha cephalotaxi]|uniref:Phosphotransferase enzyme family protein n=1 Tax=Actinopolymorpha cephalotaxi TaxID=504797 RepID=A0A1I3A5K3_9ACTN|nr:phosphotransferase [Actinopolymorpha cephalotaxi]NYH85339.1 hypothetical protein [Actinopolymorpha cephalotaxi]SFH45180.1 Phosphotransferase enzyme family protein [Actinopolymorpha cephalotaxi]
MSRTAGGTHAVDLAGDQVTKRFPASDGGCAEREWRALTLLHEHASGLAPEPLPMQTVHTAVPVDALRQVPVRPGRQAGLVTQVRRWTAESPALVDGRVGHALSAGLAWLERSGLEADGPTGVRPVFGPGDGNLANYLWDGRRVRIVDFEDSGRSDRAFELAEVTEHVPALHRAGPGPHATGPGR